MATLLSPALPVTPPQEQHEFQQHRSKVEQLETPLSPAPPMTPPQEQHEFEQHEYKGQKLDFLAHPLLRDSLSAPTPPKTPDPLNEKALSSDATSPTQHTFEASQISKVPAAAKKTAVDLVKAVEPPVTWTEIFLFVVWMFSVFFQQVWRDIKAGTWYRPLLNSDFMTHYFYIPAGRTYPRLTTSAPHSRMIVRKVPKLDAYWEENEDLTRYPEQEVVNCASSNYGGFAYLEHGIEDVMRSAIEKLPWCPAPPALEQRLRKTAADYFGADACVTAPSGFGANLIAFESIANIAKSQGRQMVFLCDGDSHNSMLTGSFYQKGATIHKFHHNDIGDLEFKLRMYRGQSPSALICVAVEGIYSMEGSMSPAPAILALKKIYNFTLLVDEAHSFMSIGSKGRGTFNRWQDLGYDCPYNGADFMTFTFSKGVSSTGGFGLAYGAVNANALRAQGEMIYSKGVESLSSVVLLRFLSILMKTKLVEERMRIVLEKSEYVADRLREAGLRVLAAQGSPMICFPVGTVRQIKLFYEEAMKEGLATIGGVPPATPLWGCRVRLCIFATTSWSDIYRLLNTCVAACQKIKVNGARHIDIDPSIKDREDFYSLESEHQSRAVDAELQSYITSLSKSYQPAIRHAHGAEPEVKDAALSALKRYSVGPGSARWFWGTFDVFVALEQRLAKLYPSINAQSGKTKGMIWSDTELGIGTALLASVVPLASSKIKHLVLIDAHATKSVLDGVRMHKSNNNVQIHFYESIKDVAELLSMVAGSRIHLTLYMKTNQGSSQSPLDLQQIALEISLQNKKLTGVNIFLDDRKGMGKLGPRSLGYLDLMESRHGENFLKDAFKPINCKVRTVVAGSFFEAFGHSGGYITGHAATVENLTWNTRGFLFSAPPLPLQAKMTNRTIELLQEGKL